MKNFSVKKIVELVNQSGILQNKIAESDLLAPDVLIEIYSKLARLLSQNCIDKYEDANVELLKERSLDQPDLYEEALRDIKTFRILKSFFEGLEMSDFTVRDLYYPEEKRTITFLSKILAFGFFREEKLNLYSELTVKIEDLMNQKETELQMSFDIQNEIQNILDQQVSEEPKIKQLIEYHEQLRSIIQALNKRQFDLHEKSSELKKKNQDLQIEILNNQELINCTSADIKKLEEDIVDSPQVLLALIDDKRLRVEGLKTSIEDFEKNIRLTQGKNDLFNKAEKEMEKSLDLLSSTVYEITKANELKDTRKTLKLKVDEKKIKLVDLDDNLKLMERKISNSNERITRFTAQNSTKFQSFQKNLTQAKKEEKENQQQVAELTSQTLQNKQKIQNLKMKLETSEKMHRETIADFQKRFDSLVDHLNEYQQKLLTEMQS